MKKIRLTRKFNPSTNEYEEVHTDIRYSSIARVVYSNDDQLEIHADHDIYIHPFDNYLLQELHMIEGFRWQDDHQLVNMNSIEGKADVSPHSPLSIPFTASSPYFNNVSEQHMEYPHPLDPADHSLFHNNPYPMCLLNTQGDVIDGNPAMLKFTGYTKPSNLRKSMYQFISPLHIERLTATFHHTLQGHSQTLELDIINHLDQVITVHVTAIPYFGSLQVDGVFVLMRDLSGEKNAQELLIRSEKLSIVGHMAAGIAHEIRNPLTSLKGFTQLLRNKAPQYNDYLNIMLTELDRINFIVSELLAVSKPQVVNMQFINIQDTLFNTIELLNTQAILNNVVLQFQPVPSIPLIRCDENQLKQVFINLLTNGIDAMPDGGKVTVTIEKPDPDHVVMSFIDHGIGIPKEHIPRLGDPFYTTKEKGTGLGLMVSFQIIQFHKGHIHIDSTLHVGTTIVVALPITGP